MSRYSVYIPDEDDIIIEKAKHKYGSVSKAFQVLLEQFKKQDMADYYKQKSEDYADLRNAQRKVMEENEKREL